MNFFEICTEVLVPKFTRTEVRWPGVLRFFAYQLCSPWISETVINWFIRCPKITTKMITARLTIINNLIFASILPVFLHFWYWCNFWSSVRTFNKCIFIWSLFWFNNASQVVLINLIAAKKRSYQRVSHISLETPAGKPVRGVRENFPIPYGATLYDITEIIDFRRKIPLGRASVDDFQKKIWYLIWILFK